MKISVMSRKMWFMKAWNVVGALVSPIGKLKGAVTYLEAVFHLWPAAMQTL